VTPPPKQSALADLPAARSAQQAVAAGWHLPAVYTGLDAEAALARGQAGLADSSGCGRLQVEGEAAADLLAQVYGAAPEAVLAGLDTPRAQIFRLRRDLFYLLLGAGDSAQAAEALDAAAAGRGLHVTSTDYSHGHAAMCLVGPRAAAILSRLCGLDFSERAFPSLAARQTSVAKTRQLIVRHDLAGLPVFSLIGDRSLAPYVWGALLEAGRPEGLQPIGLRALAALAAGAKHPMVLELL